MSVRKGNSPNPDWTPGSKIFSATDEMITLNLSELEVVDVYKLMIGSIVPRPIAFVSTTGPGGECNLAPFSFFNGASSRPPCILFSVTKKPDSKKKDTLLNIESTKEFVVNIVSEWFAEATNFCGAPFPYGVSEMTESGLTPISSLRVKPPRVKESAVQMECKLYNTMQVGDGGIGSSTIVVGEILLMHVASRVYDQGKILLEELKPVSRLAGTSYGLTTDIFDLKRPTLSQARK